MAVRTNSKDELGPLLNPDDTIQIVESHRPGLLAGNYRLSVSHQIDTTFQRTLEILGNRFTGPSQTLSQSFSSGNQDFAVAGPRFALQQDEVQGVFPPSGATGGFNGVLPHIILNRSTLPWERTAYRHTDDDPVIDDELFPPWLALLVFAQGDLESGRVKNIPIEEARQASNSGTRFPGLSDDNSTDPTGTTCSVIEVRWSILEHLLPTTTELADLIHVRSVTSAQDGSASDQAVIIANRLPKEETHVSVHLVSLEGFYTMTNNNASNPAFSFFYSPESGNPIPGRNDRIRLISLYNWSFFCQKAQGDNFAELLTHLNEEYTSPVQFHLPDAGISNDDARKTVINGYVPLRHKTRYGDRTVSWYRGPFMPFKTSEGSMPAAPRSSDELVRFIQNQGMLDVSYASAWELGRMLILKNERIATKLFDWKRKSVQFKICQHVHEECKHLPFDTSPGAAPPELDEEVQAWFESQLILLEGIPFNYLVPDERLLPPESIRFFNLDPLWLEMLCDGAFGVDRVTSADAENDLRLQVHLPAAQPMSGILIRSKLVAGWPYMTLDAYSAVPGDSPLDVESQNLKLTPVRKDFLSPTVLLMLFQQHIEAADFYLCPETMQFGVQVVEQGTTEVFSKKLRSDQPDASVPLSFRRAANDIPNRHNFRVIDITALKSRMAQTLGPSVRSPREFAFQMLDGAPLVQLRRTVSTP